VLAGGMVAASLVPLNSTMIAVGLPDVAADLDVSRASSAWLVTTYLVAMAICQPLAGRVGDAIGSGRVARLALVGFGALSLAAALAPSFPALLAARVVQAVFASALIPNVQVLVRSAVAPDRRGRAFGILGVGIGSGAAAGPVIGGLLVDGFGWRSIFLVNAPIAAVALVLVARAAVEARPHVAEDGAAAGRLLHGEFLAACTVNAVGNLTQYTMLLAVPLLLDARGWSGSETGPVLLAMTLGMLLFSTRGGSIGDLHGRRRPVVTGMVLLTGGAVLLAIIGASVPWLLVAALAVAGVGAGLSSASLQAAALDAVPAASVTSAAGLFSTSRYVGSISGSLALALLGPRAVLVAIAVVGSGAIVAARRITDVPVASGHH